MSQFERQFDAIFDDSEVASLSEVRSSVETDPEAMRQWIERSVLHAALREQLCTITVDVHETAAADEAAPSLPIYLPGCEPKPSRLRPHHFALAIAAALLVAGIAVGIVSFVAEQRSETEREERLAKRPVATLIQNTGDLRTPHGYPAEGDDFGRGEYALDSGTAEFMLTNAVNVKLRGRARMVMRNNMNVALTRGKATFVCPHEANGFTVHLHGGAKVVDMGTKFSLDVDDDDVASIRVLEGLVDVAMPLPGRDAPYGISLAANERIRLHPQTGKIATFDPVLKQYSSPHSPGEPTNDDDVFVRFEQRRLKPYADQDGAKGHTTNARIGDDGRTLHLAGNCWKAIEINLLVTPGTVIEFEMRSSQPGESVGIGVDDDAEIRTGRSMCTLAGSDVGSPTVLDYAFHDAASPTQWRTYRLPIGERLAAGFHANQLVFFADDDAAGASEASFRNVRIIQSPETPSVPKIDTNPPAKSAKHGDRPE